MTNSILESLDMESMLFYAKRADKLLESDLRDIVRTILYRLLDKRRAKVERDIPTNLVDVTLILGSAFTSNSTVKRIGRKIATDFKQNSLYLQELERKVRSSGIVIETMCYEQLFNVIKVRSLGLDAMLDSISQQDKDPKQTMWSKLINTGQI